MPEVPAGPPSGNVALLIDADNASPAHIDPVLTVLAELGQVNVRRVYGNWKKPGLKGWQDMSLKHGIEPHQQFDLTKGKNATDMKMTIDAMDLLYGRRVTAFGLMSSDSDFTPLATRIRQEGLPVYALGNDRTPEPFRQACTRFIDVGALKPEAPPVAVEVPLAESLPGSASVRRGALDADLLKLLIDAYSAARRDEKGFVSLDDMGQRAGNRSSFDARSYGFKRLSDLIEAVPNFQTERRDSGKLYVRRVR